MHHRDGHLLRVLAAFGLLYTIWGSTYLAIRIVISSIPPATCAAVRFTAAGVLMLILMRLSGQRLGAPLRELMSLAVVGFLLLVCGNGLVVWSEQYVASGFAALLVATVPLWISVLGSMGHGGERLSAGGWAGVALGMIGLTVLLWPNLGAASGAEFRGEGALLMASLCWACGSLYAKRTPVSLPPLVATGWEMLFAGIVLSLIAAATGEFRRFNPTWDSCLALAYLIVFGSCIAFSAYIWLLHHVAAAKVTTYAYVNPVIAVLLGCVCFDEPFTASIALGTPIVVTAVILVTTTHVRSPARSGIADVSSRKVA